jgi:hypothetical protein
LPSAASNRKPAPQNAIPPVETRQPACKLVQRPATNALNVQGSDADLQPLLFEILSNVVDRRVS